MGNFAELKGTPSPLFRESLPLCPLEKLHPQDLQNSVFALKKIPPVKEKSVEVDMRKTFGVLGILADFSEIIQQGEFEPFSKYRHFFVVRNDN